jgi:hypothetical protein
VGRKIPRGNDGSNYYAAREYNSNDIIYESALDALASNPCAEVWSHSGYSRQNAYVVATQPKQGKKTYINGNLDTFVGMDVSISGNDVWQPIQADWSNGTYIAEYTFTTGSTFSTVSPEDQARLQEEYTRVPDDHEFTPNFWGQCDICPGHNMYRREMNAHLFVIEEEPCLQDWRSLLAS